MYIYVVARRMRLLLLRLFPRNQQAIISTGLPRATRLLFVTPGHELRCSDKNKRTKIRISEKGHLGKQACLFCAKLLLRLRQAWSQFDNIIYYSINKMTLLQSTNRAFCPSISRKPVRTARMAASAHATAKLNFTLQDAGSTPPSQKEHTILYTHCLCPYAERAWLVLLEKVSDDHRYWLHSNY